MLSSNQDIDQFMRGVTLRTWEVFKADPLLYVVSSILVVVGGALSLGVLLGPLYAGFIDIVRRQMRGERASVHDLSYGLQSFVPSLVTLVVILGATIMGLLLLVLPGLLILVLSIFSFHFIVYQNASASRAITQSYYLLKNNFLPVLILALCLGVLTALSTGVMLALLLTCPISVIAVTVAFEELTGAGDDAAAVINTDATIAAEPA
jgi:uncharacterized membrane protein